MQMDFKLSFQEREKKREKYSFCGQRVKNFEKNKVQFKQSKFAYMRVNRNCALFCVQLVDVPNYSQDKFLKGKYLPPFSLSLMLLCL